METGIASFGAIVILLFIVLATLAVASVVVGAVVALSGWAACLFEDLGRWVQRAGAPQPRPSY